MKAKLTALVAVSSAFLFTACNTEETTTTEKIQQNYVNMAYAVYGDSLTTATVLKTAVDTFIAAPTEANLLAARVAYKATRGPYQQSEIMRFDTSIAQPGNLAADGGPASVDDWEGQVNAWPLDENHIISLIQGDETINIDLLLAQNGADEQEANVTTGVHAIEFMLWGMDNNGTAAGAGERPASDFDTLACLDTFCERRGQYLSAATNLLVSDLTIMAAEWSPAAEVTQGTLAYNFLHSDLALEYIVNSINAMATDELAGARMGSGLTLGDPEEEHDCFSDLSHVAIYHNFQGVKNAFYGNYGDISGKSIGDLIMKKDADLYARIDTALTSIESKMLSLYNAGEREVNPIRFDQIIGQSSSATERIIAEAAVDELTALSAEFSEVVNLLQLQTIDTGGSGD